MTNWNKKVRELKSVELKQKKTLGIFENINWQKEWDDALNGILLLGSIGIIIVFFLLSH